MSLLRSRRPAFGNNFGETLKKSAEKLKEVEDALKNQMPHTVVEETIPEPQPKPQPKPQPNPPKTQYHPNTTEEAEIRGHRDLSSDHDYDTPYGMSDRHNFHAVCLDSEGRLIFLSDDTKSGLSEKINDYPGMDDVIAVYGGNLIYFEERRFIHID